MSNLISRIKIGETTYEINDPSIEVVGWKDNNNNETFNNEKNTIISGSNFAHAEGNFTAAGNRAHAEGEYNCASGDFSHAEGKQNYASGRFSHAEGGKENVISYPATNQVISANSLTITLNKSKSIEYPSFTHKTIYCYDSSSGIETDCRFVQEDNSDDKIIKLTLNAPFSSAIAYPEGNFNYIKVFPFSNIASGESSHVEGSSNQAIGNSSHAEGIGTIAYNEAQHVQGKYNTEPEYDENGILLNEYAHIVGGGTSETDRRNIHTIDWAGNAEFAGNVEAKNITATGDITANNFTFDSISYSTTEDRIIASKDIQVSESEGNRVEIKSNGTINTTSTITVQNSPSTQTRNITLDNTGAINGNQLSVNSIHLPTVNNYNSAIYFKHPLDEHGNDTGLYDTIYAWKGDAYISKNHGLDDYGNRTHRKIYDTENFDLYLYRNNFNMPSSWTDEQKTKDFIISNLVKDPIRKYRDKDIYSYYLETNFLGLLLRNGDIYNKTYNKWALAWDNGDENYGKVSGIYLNEKNLEIIDYSAYVAREEETKLNSQTYKNRAKIQCPYFDNKGKFLLKCDVQNAHYSKNQGNGVYQHPKIIINTNDDIDISSEDYAYLRDVWLLVKINFIINE